MKLNWRAWMAQANREAKAKGQALPPSPGARKVRKVPKSAVVKPPREPHSLN